jgi:type I restriction enzyme M protein
MQTLEFKGKSFIYALGSNANKRRLAVINLAPQGMAGFVLANGRMSSNQSGEGDIRRALIETDVVDCMVALPGQLFYSTQIPVCRWFLAKNKAAEAKRGFRDRRKEVLFISRKPTFINFSNN